MNLDEFLNKLKETTSQIKWSVDKFGYIRGLDGNNLRYCPLTAVNRVVNNNWVHPVCASDAAKELGIDESVDIVVASDNVKNDEFFSSYLRKDLLKAVGLERE